MEHYAFRTRASVSVARRGVAVAPTEANVLKHVGSRMT